MVSQQISFLRKSGIKNILAFLSLKVFDLLTRRDSKPAIDWNIPRLIIAYMNLYHVLNIHKLSLKGV